MLGNRSADGPDWWHFPPRAAQSALCANLVQLELGREAATATVREDIPSLSREKFTATPIAERPQLIEEFISEQLSRVLRIDVEDLDVNQSLGNLGIDSLMAVELRNHVQASLGIVIPVAQLLQDPSISQLAEGILDQLSDTSTTVSDVAITTDATGSNEEDSQQGLLAEQALGKLETMSDSEVEAMLSQMLDGEKENS